MSDFSDAITYAQSRSEVNKEKIGIWGTSYSGDHVLRVGAVDRRVKTVLSQVPCVDRWANFHRLVRVDLIPAMNQLFQDDRLARAEGKSPGILPIVQEDLHQVAALPSRECYEFFSLWDGKSSWKNEITIKSFEALRAYNPSAYIHRISPTPLLMTISENDLIAPTDLALETYSLAREPKQLHILPGAHFDAYTGRYFELNANVQLEFLRKHLCS